MDARLISSKEKELLQQLLLLPLQLVYVVSSVSFGGWVGAVELMISREDSSDNNNSSNNNNNNNNEGEHPFKNSELG